MADTQPETRSWFAHYSFVIILLLAIGLFLLIVWVRDLRLQVAARTADFHHEIEGRRRTVADLKLHQQQLIQADKMAALGVLVSGMAHEINNPNGLILLNLPLITEIHKDIAPILEDHYRQHGDFSMGGLNYSRMRREVPLLLDEMQDAAKRIKRIVDDLRNFSRKTDAGSKELVDVNEVVRTSLRLVDNVLKRSAISYSVYYSEPLPLVKGDFHRLEQVIVNLVLNACQAVESSNIGKQGLAHKSLAALIADGESPDFSTWDVFVTTTYDHEAGTVVVSVRDEGIGILPEHLPRLTDPFFTTKRDEGGTGLGLAISSEIIRDHNGTIDFMSRPGEGATVVLTLPVAAGEA